MRTIRRCRRVAALAAVAAFAAGCGTSTEPEARQDLDTDAALADHDAVAAALADPELDVFRALAGRTPFGGGPSAIDALAASSRRDGHGFALELARRLSSGGRSGAAAAPIVSDTHRGDTFVYDAGSGDWAVDPERTGAPENGVRFVLYELDASGEPIVEEEVGWADLLDEGDASAEDVVLRLVVVVRDDTILDYATTLDENANRGLLTVRGHLIGEETRLDFDIEAVGTSTGGESTLDVAFELRVDQRDFSITGNVSGVEDGPAGEGDIDITARHRSHSIRVDAHGSGGTIEGTVFVNGDIFATASGTADDPVFVGASGEPLTYWERMVLWRVFDGLEGVFDLLEDLLDPVEDLVFLGIIL